MKWDDNCAVVQDSDVNASIEGRRLQSPQEVNQNLVESNLDKGKFGQKDETNETSVKSGSGISHLKVVSDDILDKSNQKTELHVHNIVEDVADAQKPTKEESVSFFDVTSYYFTLISR